MPQMSVFFVDTWVFSRLLFHRGRGCPLLVGHGIPDLSLIRCVATPPSFQMHVTFLEARRVMPVELNLRRVNKEMANFLNSLGRVSCPRPHASLLLHLTCLSNTRVIRKTQDLIFCVKNQSSVLRTMGDKLFWRSKREPRHISRGDRVWESLHQKGRRRELMRL